MTENEKHIALHTFRQDLRSLRGIPNPAPPIPASVAVATPPTQPVGGARGVVNPGVQVAPPMLKKSSIPSQSGFKPIPPQ